MVEPSSPRKDSMVDVLVVGAGPSGMMLSLYLSEIGVSHRVIDQRGTRALNGRADGFQVRTVEIWDSFGLADKLRTHGTRFAEWALWTPTRQAGGGIARQRRELAVGNDVSRMRTGTFHQGFIEAALIEGANKRGGPPVERGVRPVSLEINEREVRERSAHPVVVDVRHLPKSEREDWRVNAHSFRPDGSLRAERGTIDAFGTNMKNITPADNGTDGTIERIYAKYIVGTDGGHSWVRRQLPGFLMEGASTNSVWALMDIVPLTNFPDIRKL